MMLRIRPTRLEELDDVMGLYDHVRAYMARMGNAHQWGDGYPWRTTIEDDLRQGRSYVCVNGEEQVVGTFYFAIEQDLTYQQIYLGSWLSDAPYGVIHRIASDHSSPHVARACLTWCLKQISHIRVDTHEANRPMRRMLELLGFVHTGTIYVRDGSPRLAFEFIETSR